LPPKGGLKPAVVNGFYFLQQFYSYILKEILF